MPAVIKNKQEKIKSILMTNIYYKGRALFFKKPIQVKITQKEGLYIFENKYLNIYVFDKSIEKCLLSMAEDVFLDYDELVKEENIKKLSEGAKKIRKKLIMLIDREFYLW